jgi:hypothetical protein
MSHPHDHIEYGVQLPNGDISWGSYLGCSLGTEDERGILFLSLYKTAQQLGFPVNEFMNRFRWATRSVTDDTTRYTMDDPAVIPSGVPKPLAPPAPEPDDDGHAGLYT